MKRTEWLSVFRKVVPADYEEWLEGLALEGWNVERIHQFSSLAMVFHKTEPKRYRYVFDLNAFPKADYRATYEQFGWEYVGQMASCFVWRMEYTDVRPESFTDEDSRTRRNKRVRGAVIACLVLFLTGIAASLAGIVLCALSGRADKILELALETGLLGLIAAYLAWVTAQIQRNIHR